MACVYTIYYIVIAGSRTKNNRPVCVVKLLFLFARSVCRYKLKCDRTVMSRIGYFGEAFRLAKRLEAAEVMRFVAIAGVHERLSAFIYVYLLRVYILHIVLSRY